MTDVRDKDLECQNIMVNGRWRQATTLLSEKKYYTRTLNNLKKHSRSVQIFF